MIARGLILAAALLGLGCGSGARVPAERTIDDSAITVAPALDSPILPGKSVVWCASFQLAWNRLTQGVAKGPPRLQGAEDLCQKLNSHIADGDLPSGSSYAAAGWVKDGIRERIRGELARLFPSLPAPDLGGSGTEAIAYAYLEVGLKFPIPFFEMREPLKFTDSSGRATEVSGFGIRKEDDYAYPELRNQVRVLFGDRDPPYPSTNFAIDPCSESNPVQIILASVPPKASLAATVAMVEEKARSDRGDEHSHRLGPNDILLIPNIVFRVAHHFRELEGKERTFLNPGLEGKYLGEAIETIRFRLDRSGAELGSEAKDLVLPIPSKFIFDGPFLVYLKKRSGGAPFFALWVDGASALSPW